VCSLKFLRAAPIRQPLPSWPPGAGFADLPDPCNGFVFRKRFQTHPDLLEAIAKDQSAGKTCNNTTEPLQAPFAQ
jgi:hypothetical protein